MATFIEAAGRAIRQAYCDEVARTPQWQRRLSDALLPGVVSDAANALVCTVCGDCGEDYAVPPPFTGGQCGGVLYDIYAARYNPGTGTYGPVERQGGAGFQVLGPVASIVETKGADCFSGGPANQTTLTATSGAPGGGSVALGPTCLAGPGGSGPHYTSIEARPAFGGDPTECGSPPPDLPPFEPIEIDIDITFENDEGVDVTIPFTLILAPVYVALDGTVNVPISLNGPLFELNGTVELTPEFNVELNFGGGKSKGPGSEEDPELGPGQEGYDGEDQEVGPDETIIGVVVRSTVATSDRTTLIPHTVGPDILAPGVATVRFAIATGSLISWTPDIRVKGVNEYIHCPVPWGAVNVSVAAEQGWQNTFSVVRGRPLQEDA